MPQWTRFVGALAAAAALAASAACTSSADDGGEGADPQAGGETDLLDLLNESSRLVGELSAAENRIIENCLEDQGHTVHDRFTLMDVGGRKSETLSSDAPTAPLFPDADTAAKWGFGAWADTDEGMAAPDYEEYRAARRTGDGAGIDDATGAEAQQDMDAALVDNAEFEALPPEEQEAWHIAYGGVEYAVWNGLSDEEIEDQYKDDEGVQTTPKPGGCRLEMIQALYGEPELVVDEEEQYARWSGRPESPEYQGSGLESITPNYRERVADDEAAFLECLVEHDRGVWEFNDFGELPTTGYFVGLYSGEWTSGDGVDYAEGNPGPSSDLPSDFEGLREYEAQVAVDFVACGEATGFAAASAAAWEAVHLEYYQSIEPELFAWQEELNTALTKAQEIIDG